MSPERRASQHPPKFNQLFEQFDQAKKVRGKERAANEIVSFATERNTDWLSVLHAVQKGYSAFAGHGTERQGGFTLLVGIDDYFNRQGVAAKLLIPGTEPLSSDGAREITEILESIKGTKARIPSNRDIRPIFTNIDSLVQRVETSLPEISSTENIMFLIASAEFLSINSSSDKAVNERFESYLEIIKGEKAEGGVDKWREFWDWAMAQPDIEGLTHPYTGKFGEVSLEDIANEEDRTVAAKKILRFIANAPKGNVHWNGIILGAVLFSAMSIHADAGGEVEAPESLVSLMESQKIIADRFLAPAVTGEIDPEFDSLFGDILKGQSQRVAGDLIANILGSAIIGSSNISFFKHPDQVARKFEQLLPFDAYAFDEFVQTHSIRRFVGDNIFVSEFYKTHREEIFDNLRARFASTNNWSYVEKFVSGSLSLDILSMSKDYLLERITENVGENFVDKLNSRIYELSRLNGHIWTDIDQASYLPHSEAIHIVEFSDGSLPEVMGLGAVSFAVNSEGGLEFYLSQKDARTMIAIGKIDETGNASFAFELGEGFEGLEALLKNIVVMSYHDLIMGQKHIKSARPTETTRKSKPDAPPKEAGARSLPRAQVVYERPSAKTGKLLVRSDELVGAISDEQESAGFKPRKVDTFRRKLPGAWRYKQIVADLCFPKTEKTQPEIDQMLEDLAKARDKVFKPNPNKVKNLPKRFQLDAVPDPVTGDEIILETWVVEHTSPKLTPEEEASLLVHYQKRYKGGSALNFLDYLKTWIFE